MPANPRLLLFLLPVVGVLCVAKAIHLKATAVTGSMVEAAYAGDIHQLQLHLNAHEPVNMANPTGTTPLSASLGHAEATKFLLEHGALANIEADRNETPLMLAAEADNAAAIDVLATHKASLETVSPEGETALSIAVMSGNRAAALALLNHGATPNVRNRIGASPIHYASGLNQIDLIKVLTKAGANLNARTNIGMTPLGRAVLNGRLEAAELLLKLGAKHLDPDYTLMHYAALSGALPTQLRLIVEPHLGKEVGQDLITGTRQAYQRFDLNTEIRAAAVIPMLVKHGFPIEGLCKEGYTPLQLAAVADNAPAAKALLEAGANPAAKDKSGETALSLARRLKCESVLKVLSKTS